MGVSRAFLYELIRAKKIKSVSLRERGQIKGIRLVSAESIDAYIESFLEESSSAGDKEVTHRLTGRE
jgi:hypothetical protein